MNRLDTSNPVSQNAPRRRFDLLVRVVEGETVVLDRSRGLIHQLNGTASLIWDRCNGDQDPSQIAAAVVGTFEVDFETARQDVARILRKLSELGLLESPA